MSKLAATVVCPCCLGKAVIPAGAPVVGLGPQQIEIYNAVRAAKYGIANARIADVIYAERADGGPATALNVISSQICTMNKALATVGEKIKTIGGVYHLQRIGASR
jgi:hypothetical protein